MSEIFVPEAAVRERMKTRFDDLWRRALRKEVQTLELAKRIDPPGAKKWLLVGKFTKDDFFKFTSRWFVEHQSEIDQSANSAFKFYGSETNFAFQGGEAQSKILLKDGILEISAFVPHGLYQSFISEYSTFCGFIDDFVNEFIALKKKD